MPLENRVTLKQLYRHAEQGQPIVMLALYDSAFAFLAEKAGLDGVIVGDSVAMSVYGYEDTLQADMDMMIRHTAAVRRGAPNMFIIADMPYMSYQPSVELAVRNAGRFLAEGRADAVKFEGGSVILDQIEAALKAGIPVVGHLGFTPQSAALAGGVKVETREPERAAQLVEEAMVLDRAGICLLILECVPQNVSAEVVKRVRVPVIGIGSGPACHGQVTLVYDLLGLYPGPLPRFVEKYAELGDAVFEAFGTYLEQTRSGRYPAARHCYNMKPAQQEAFAAAMQEMDKHTGR